MSASGRACLVGVALASLLAMACTEQSDISFFVLVKSSNFAQDSTGELTLLNYHFFSEVFLLPNGSLESGRLQRAGADDAPLEYEDRGENFYMEMGHFDSQEEVDQAHPNGTYFFSLTAPSVRIRDVPLELAGPSGQTDIPAPITISLEQAGSQVSPLEVDPDQNLVVRWSEYSNGRSDPRGIVDDMIFVVVADCHGERVFHTGLPFQGPYTTYRTNEITVLAERLTAGQPYSTFVEFPHVVDSDVVKGVPGFTSYATATYLDLHTTGPPSDATCPDAPPPMDTGQTDRMESVRVP
jgi:hypothetical protein